MQNIFLNMVKELLRRFKVYLTLATDSLMCKLLLLLIWFINALMIIPSLTSVKVAKIYVFLCHSIANRCLINYYGYHVKACDCEGLLMFHPNYEYNATRILLRLIYRGAVFIDIGACIGRYTLIAARIVGPEGLVIALEPVPENYKVLVHNIYRNNINNVIPLPLAAWKNNTIIELVVPPDKSASTAKKELHHFLGFKLKGAKLKVKAMKVDDLLLKVLKVQQVDVMKIDVEGAEVEVLEGAVKVLKKFKPKILIEIHSFNSYIRVKEFLNSFSYKLFIIRGLNIMLALPS